MALTRANIEQIAVKRCGALLTASGLATTYAGANSDLNDPIGWGIRQSGGSVSVPTLVTDADAATVATDNFDRLFDLVELRTLQTVANALATSDRSIGGRSESPSSLQSHVRALIETKAKNIEVAYGIGLPELTSGFVETQYLDSLEDDT